MDEKIKKALCDRKLKKSSKPKFKRVQGHQFKKLEKESWRKPKGLDNKVRKQRRGKPQLPKIGFSSPKLVRGLNPQGLKEKIVFNIQNLKEIDTEKQIPTISKTLGKRKKLELLKEALKLKMSFSNVKNNEKEISKIELIQKKSQEQKKTKKEAIKNKEKEKTKNTKEIENKEEKTSNKNNKEEKQKKGGGEK